MYPTEETGMFPHDCKTLYPSGQSFQRAVAICDYYQNNDPRSSISDKVIPLYWNILNFAERNQLIRGFWVLNLTCVKQQVIFQQPWSIIVFLLSGAGDRI